MKKWLLATKTLIYVIFGILVMIFHTQLLSSLNYLVGAVVIVEAIESILVDMKYLKHVDNNVAIHFTFLLVGIVMMFHYQEQLEFICIAWAVISILNGFIDIIKGRNTFCVNKYISIIEIIIGATSIILALMLLLDPIEHVLFHIVILGVEFIIEGLMILTEAFPKLLIKKEKES